MLQTVFMLIILIAQFLQLLIYVGYHCEELTREHKQEYVLTYCGAKDIESQHHFFLSPLRPRTNLL